MDLSALYKSIKIDTKPDPAIIAKEEEERQEKIRQEQQIIDKMIEQVVNNIKPEKGYSITEFRESIPYGERNYKLGPRIRKVREAFVSAGFEVNCCKFIITGERMYSSDTDYCIMFLYWQQFDRQTTANIEKKAMEKYKIEN